MMERLSHYCKRALQLGPRKTIQIIRRRFKSAAFDYYWRYYARERANGGACNHVLCVADNSTKQFGSFSCLNTLYPEISDDRIIRDADSYCSKTFDLLGSGPVTFDHFPWHTDFRLQQQQPKADCHFNAHTFYKDIKIKVGATENLIKDIKVPWELSRFQHLMILGRAYQLTNDAKYMDNFVLHIADWFEHNPYLYGTNWVCPMEVGIRAINWIVAYAFFKDADIDRAFWQRFFCSLQDHQEYLEHNWEIFDGRTSNHYLSDLIGYLYLCHLFNDEKKLSWVHSEILKEFDKQVFGEGANYESSTRYHTLVTELFYHFYLICNERALELPESFVTTFSRMIAYKNWTTDHGGYQVQIGDDDSGSVLKYGLPKLDNAWQIAEVTHFNAVGVSIIKTNKKQFPQWHVTLRHHAYQPFQPTSHLHNDVGSLTVSINGIPVIIDPGSFVYTPSAVWRNRFRSVAMHNTCYIEGEEPVSFNNDLFALEMPHAVAHNKDEGLLLRTQHRLYQRFGLIAERTVQLSDNRTVLTIADSWLSSNDEQRISCWNFTLAPHINVEQKEAAWHLMYQGKTLLILTSPDLTFECADTWVSLHYGSKVASKRLCANVLIDRAMLERKVFLVINAQEF
ncbi:MAG TPA: heparinase II/III family protein [Candidatus Babeliales bacterium]|nr:heparinase II/III family protein [Candidatus Babeliales bacterium]